MSRGIVSKPEVNKRTWKMALSEENGDILTEFRASFFAMSRLTSFPWTAVEDALRSSESSEFLSELLQQTSLHPLCRKFPPSARYRRLFLSELIRRQEAADCDPLDQLYDALAEALGAEETSECYKSYLLPSGIAVSLLENLALISEGTTGLVTWEAALYLAEWALDHQQVFAGRSVLELGSGVGLTGITICRSCSPHRFVFSDCHATVLQKLRDNVRLNGLSADSSPVVSVDELDWTAATSEEKLREIRADVVIAADVVYDPEVAESLVKLLSEILSSSPDVQPEIFICSTVRNPQTYSSFKLQLENSGISQEVMTGPVSPLFPYNRLAAIELIKLYR